MIASLASGVRPTWARLLDEQTPAEADPKGDMTYVVNESCIKCKLMDCVEVCPVDCFYEGANMLVIHPDECRLRRLRARMPR